MGIVRESARATYGIDIQVCLLLRRASGIWLLVTVLAMSAGCSSRGNDKRVVEDGLGRTVHLPARPSRVVTLAPNVTEIVYAAGAGHMVVGAGLPDDFPPAVDTLPRYATYPLDFEAVAALAPDVAFASDQVNGLRDAETLAALGIPTYFLSSSSLGEIFADIERVGGLLETAEAAGKSVDSLRRRVDDLRNLTREAGRPSTLFLIGQETLFSFGSESYIHELIALAGGRSATADLNAVAPILSEEYVLSIQPEIIIGPWDEDYDAAELLRHHPTWSVVPAVADGRVHGVNADLVERPGPRLVEGAWAMARVIHPELFNGR